MRCMRDHEGELILCYRIVAGWEGARLANGRWIGWMKKD